MKRLILVLLFAVVSVAICTAQATIRNFHQEGMGSQDIESEELTASHPSLPLGTMVRVTNPQNDKQVTAKIIGRIPASVDRIVDLSTGVARGLSMAAQGSGPVILEVVDNRKPPEEVAVVQPPKVEDPPPKVEEVPPPKAEEPKAETPPPKAEEPKAQEPSRTDTTTTTDIASDTRSSTNTDNSTDTRNQTTAPVSSQSPVFNIYNVLQSPNSFATDSAPVNDASRGSQPSVNTDAPSAGGTGTGTVTGSPRIIAVAPSGNVSASKQTVTQPPPVPQEPAAATATASIVTAPAPALSSSGVKTVPVLPIMPPLEPAAPQSPAAQPAYTPAPQPPAQPAPAPASQPANQPAPAPVSALPRQQVQLVESGDVGTALISPYMPNPKNGKVYRVQVGAFTNTWHAKEAFDNLTNAGLKPAYERNEDYIRVVISGVDAADMPTMARLIGQAGFREALIREEN